MQELIDRTAQRKTPQLWEKIRDSIVGVLIIGVVGFLKWKADLGDIYFGIGMLFGGTMVSKSLGMDFLAAIKDKISK